MMKRFCITLMLVSLALSAASCFEPTPPKAEYIDYQISRVTLQGIDVDFYFDVENSNPLPIDVSKYSYKVYINNRLLLSESRAGFNIPAKSKKRITIPVNVRYERVFGTALSLVQLIGRGEDSVAFRIEGEVSAGTMGVTVGTPLKASGTIPLPKNVNF